MGYKSLFFLFFFATRASRKEARTNGEEMRLIDLRSDRDSFSRTGKGIEIYIHMCTRIYKIYENINTSYFSPYEFYTIVRCKYGIYNAIRS